MKRERWRPIPNWECMYEASDQGQIRSVERRIVYKDGRSQTYKGQVLKPGIDTHGYLIVSLCRNKTQKTRLVHQLVLEAFVGKKPSKREARHVNGNKTDN